MKFIALFWLFSFSAISQVQLPNGHTRGNAALVKHKAKLSALAVKYGKRTSELEELILRDRSVVLNQNGEIYFSEETSINYLEETESFVNPLASSIPDAATFFLHSRPGSPRKVVLDFTGESVTTPYWNGGRTIAAEAFDLDGSPGSFTPEELLRIRDIWLRVAEDFAPFDVDITTEEIPDSLLYLPTGGVRIIVTPTSSWYGSAGGVAYLNTFTWGIPVPGWVFAKLLGNGANKVAEAISHETGHTLGLSHQTLFDAAGNFIYEYNPGNAQWAPIMGNSYGKNLSTWNLGTSTSSKTIQDDVALIKKVLPVVPDDASGSLSQSTTSLRSYEEAGAQSFRHQGTIGFRGDVDVLKLSVGEGPLHLDVRGAYHATNLDLRVRLLSSSTVLADSNPPGTGPVAISLENLPEGEYALEVSVVGENGAYTDYGLQGRYYITGSANINYSGNTTTPPAEIAPSVNAGADVRLTLPTNSVTLTGSATDSDGQITSLEWTQVSGPSLAQLAGQSSTSLSVSGLVEGTYVFRLSATDNSGLMSSDNVQVSVARKKGGKR